MAAAAVPTAAARVCTTSAQAAAALDEFGPPYVVKDDGLAAGKGVVVTSDRRGRAGSTPNACERVVIEEFLDGPEVSLFCVTDGTTVVPLLPAQDFKRIGDGDTGPNTGGMGAYAPLAWLPSDVVTDVVTRVAQPTIDEMARRATPFVGVLYVGLAMTGKGPRVVEFNARFGDPETQVVLALLATPLAGLLHAAATGRLAGHPPLQWRDGQRRDGRDRRRRVSRGAAHRRRDHRRRPARRDPRRHPPARGRCDRRVGRASPVDHRDRPVPGPGA